MAEDEKHYGVWGEPWCEATVDVRSDGGKVSVVVAKLKPCPERDGDSLVVCQNGGPWMSSAKAGTEEARLLVAASEAALAYAKFRLVNPETKD